MRFLAFVVSNIGREQTRIYVESYLLVFGEKITDDLAGDEKLGRVEVMMSLLFIGHHNWRTNEVVVDRPILSSPSFLLLISETIIKWDVENSNFIYQEVILSPAFLPLSKLLIYLT